MPAGQYTVVPCGSHERVASCRRAASSAIRLAGDRTQPSGAATLGTVWGATRTSCRGMTRAAASRMAPQSGAAGAPAAAPPQHHPPPRPPPPARRAAHHARRKPAAPAAAQGSHASAAVSWPSCWRKAFGVVRLPLAADASTGTRSSGSLPGAVGDGTTCGLLPRNTVTGTTRVTGWPACALATALVLYCRTAAVRLGASPASVASPLLSAYPPSTNCSCAVLRCERRQPFTAPDGEMKVNRADSSAAVAVSMPFRQGSLANRS